MLDIGYRVASDLCLGREATNKECEFCTMRWNILDFESALFEDPLYYILKNANSYIYPLCLYCTFLLEIIAQSITFFTLKAVKWKLPPRNLDLLKMPVSFLLLLRYYWNQMQMKIFCIIVWYYVEWKWVLFIIFDTESTWVMEYVQSPSIIHKKNA